MTHDVLQTFGIHTAVPVSLNHVLFNTGKSEQITVKNFELRPYDRIALQWVLEQATGLEGVDIGSNIILKVHADTYRYTATFAAGTYRASEIFLVSCGARTKDATDGMWRQLRESFAPKYNVGTPIKCKPAGPMVVDMILPCSRPEAMEYLYSSDCYDFCLKLGWALLYPECIRV